MTAYEPLITVDGIVMRAGSNDLSVNISQLADVAGTPNDTQVLTYNSGNSTWYPADPAGGVSDHGDLTGLDGDDHTIYILADGTRAMTGCLTTNGVTSTGNLTLNSGNRVVVEKSLSIGGNHIYANDVYFDITSNDNFVVNMVVGAIPSTVSGQGCALIGVAHEIQANSVNCGSYSGTNHTINGCDDAITCGGYGHEIDPGSDRCGAFAGKDNSTGANTTDSVLLGGEHNIISGPRSATVGGYYNYIDTGCYACAIIGGQYNSCNEVTSVIIGGDTNKTTGVGSIILGGKGNTASGKYTVMHGYYGLNPIYGAYAHTGGKIATAGDTQCFRFNVFGQTSGNVTGNLSLDGAGLNVVQPDKTVWYHRITIATQSVNGTYGSGSRIYAVTRRAGATHLFITTGNVTPNPFISLDFNNVYPMAMTISANGEIYLSGNGPASVNHNWNALWDVTQTGYF